MEIQKSERSEEILKGFLERLEDWENMRVAASKSMLDDVARTLANEEATARKQSDQGGSYRITFETALPSIYDITVNLTGNMSEDVDILGRLEYAFPNMKFSIGGPYPRENTANTNAVALGK